VFSKLFCLDAFSISFGGGLRRSRDVLAPLVWHETPQGDHSFGKTITTLTLGDSSAPRIARGRVDEGQLDFPPTRQAQRFPCQNPTHDVVMPPAPLLLLSTEKDEIQLLRQLELATTASLISGHSGLERGSDAGLSWKRKHSPVKVQPAGTEQSSYAS
jgi:hypothetical protein